MTQPIRLAKVSDRPRRIGDWAETQTARDITRSLEMVTAIDGPGFTMIAGGPGTGKTTAVRRFCEARGHDALYIQAARGEGTVWNFARALSGHWGHAVPHFNTHAEARFILAQHIGRNTLLVVDEAQYLHQRNRRTGQTGAAFEWLRAFVIARIQHRTFEQLEADIAANFPPDRRASKSALHRWWHRNLASFGMRDGSA